MVSERVKGSLSGWGYHKLMVRLPCGSQSTKRTFLLSLTSPIPRLTQVVVLVVPPFWFEQSMICVFIDFTSFLSCVDSFWK